VQHKSSSEDFQEKVKVVDNCSALSTSS